MEMAQFLVRAHVIEGRSVSSLAKEHGVSRSWIYKLLARYRAEGELGLVARSRRPHRSPRALGAEVEDLIVEIRKGLLAQGLDAGADTIVHFLAREGVPVPSASTIWRVLRRRGCVNPQPKKRPKSSYRRFEADLPNECWQSDMTHYQLAGGEKVEILNFLDDHSRKILASRVLSVTKATHVVGLFDELCATYGEPASVLTDNGAIFTARYRNGRTGFESELERRGVVAKHSSPYHPQTCGKIERWHQSLKNYLFCQGPAHTLDELQRQVDAFCLYYNEQRPHRALQGRTPSSAYDARVKAYPCDTGREKHFRIRHDKVDKTGAITLRYGSRLHHIGMGRRWIGEVVTLMVANRDIRVVTQDGELIRHLELDPRKDYQPLSEDLLSPMS